MAQDGLSITAVGAHLADCWPGRGGVALKAARRGRRVTMIHGMSVRGSWPVAGGREAEIEPVLERLGDENAVALVTLGRDCSWAQSDTRR